MSVFAATGILASVLMRKLLTFRTFYTFLYCKKKKNCGSVMPAPCPSSISLVWEGAHWVKRWCVQFAPSRGSRQEPGGDAFLSAEGLSVDSLAFSASLGTSQQTRINWVTGKGRAGEEGRPWSPTVLLLCRAFCMKVIQSPDSLHTLPFGSGLLELSPATYVFIYSFTLKKRFDYKGLFKKRKAKRK